jgi:hypothetical protein
MMMMMMMMMMIVMTMIKTTGWTVWYSNLGSGKVFFCSAYGPDRLWSPLSLLFNRYRVSPLGVQRPGLEGDN